MQPHLVNGGVVPEKKVITASGDKPRDRVMIGHSIQATSADSITGR
jgi:hypothetical protein